MTMLEAALEYAQAGFKVFPLVPTQKNPLTSAGVKDATKNEDLIRAWWSASPNANIGIPMGERIFALDIDYKDGCDREFLKKLPPTVICETPSGGHHAYFKAPQGGITNGLIVERGVTVRSVGYYFVVPPSIFIDPKKNINARYKWPKRSIADGEIAECPEWLLEYSKKEAEKKEPYKIPDEINEGERNNNFWKLACSLRAKGMDEDGIIAALKALNERTNPKVSEAEILDFAKRACKYPKGVPVSDLSEKSDDSTDDDSYKKKQKLVKSILDIRYKLQTDHGQSVLYKITNINKKELAVCYNQEEALRRLSTNLTEVTGRVYAPKTVKTMYDLWRLSTDSLKEKPKPFCWANEDDWSFKKLDFYPSEGGFPAWSEFLDRLSSAEDFMAFVWSIFEIKNKSRQFLYLSDPVGESGKSTIIKVLGWVFGDSFTAISNSTVSGNNYRWLMGQLYGKRLVAWPDCKNPKFCMSETVRNFTSGDSVVVEFKGESPFATEMYLKFIIGSNHEPQITSGGADTSRLVHIKVSENKDKKDDPDWADRLRLELPHFLWACKAVYEKKCPNHGKIILDAITKELVKNADEDLESPFEALCADRFVFGDEFETSVSEWVNMYKQEKLNGLEIGNLKEYLKRVHGIKIKREIKDGIKTTKYFGLKIVDKSQKDTLEWMNKQ